ncbi:aspartate aminotransferase family protein [Bacillota bacterium]
MVSRFISPLPEGGAVVAEHGDGVYIYDHAGRKYLDGSSGAMTVSFGHNNPEITNAVKEQLDKIAFTYRSQFTSKPLEEVCTMIAGLAPGDLNYVSLANSGSEAAELAMKMACSYWSVRGKPMKQRIISRWSSYHGSTMGALSMSGNAARRKEYSLYLRDYPLLELPLCHCCPYEKDPTDCNLFCANYLQKMINRLGSENISAAIFEPITGASGAGITPPEGYFTKIQEICRNNEILLIMDEVITGFGRTGKNFASEHWNLSPDIIVFGKGISGGYYPMSGIIVSGEIYDALKEKGVPFTTGHTFGGNPMACACAKATLDYFESHDILGNVGDKGTLLEKKLVGMMARQSVISDIRGRGLLWGVEFMKDRAKKEYFGPGRGITEKIVRACFDRGLIVYPSAGYIDGILGDSIVISPPLVISEYEINELTTLLEAAIEAVFADL